MQNTSLQYDAAIKLCKDIFLKKMKDYGTAWRNLRPTSLTDQIFIKAQRIKSIEEKGTQKVIDDIKGEYIGIINYCIIALIQMELENDNRVELPYEEVEKLYTKYANQTKKLMDQAGLAQLDDFIQAPFAHFPTHLYENTSAKILDSRLRFFRNAIQDLILIFTQHVLVDLPGRAKLGFRFLV